MSVIIQGDEIRAIAAGIKVDRATATLPQTTDGALFSISGGRVAVVSLIGEVTTVIQTQANNTKLKYNPTATGADTDLCAVLDISADAVGTLYSLTGTFATAMQDSLLCLASSEVLQSPLVLSEGDIELDCAASNTGSVSWTLIYYPIDDGASVAAA